MLGVIKFAGASGVPPQDIVDVFEGLFEHGAFWGINKNAEMAAGKIYVWLALSAPTLFAGLHFAIVMRQRWADLRGGIVTYAAWLAYTGSSAMKNYREHSLQLQRSWRMVRYRLVELVRRQ